MPDMGWRVTGDCVRIELVDQEGNVVETRPTRYGTLKVARAAARQANRDLAGKR